MMCSDFHVHTTFSDGKHTPEEMILSAIEKGMTAIGFSDHSYTPFDESYCIAKEKQTQYYHEVRSLRETYKGRIAVFCGIEQDFYSEAPTLPYDYSIGSVHYLKLGEEYVPVDENADILMKAAKTYFDGDMYALAEEYFKTVAQVIEKTNADIIGHFDLITKFNEGFVLFDETAPRYRKAASEALQCLLQSGRPFEINTGAMSRGYRTTPYPAKEWIDIILKSSGKLILSSDSHAKETLCYQFEMLKYPCEDFLTRFSEASQD